VVDEKGVAVPSQVEDGKVLFVAKAPSVGYAVYHVSPASEQGQSSDLKVTSSSLENARYRIQLNSDGDVSSVYDKQLKKELLSSPIRLAISNDKPKVYPAWNMDFYQEQAAPRTYVSGPAQIRIKEQGPVRVALEVTRETEGSKFVQTIRLSAGDSGNRVEFGNAIDWKTLSANLKATFPFSATNENATYNWDIGTVQRPNANERQFEVASHRWIDLTDKSGSYGTTILTDYKNGSDKPNDNTIRLTLMRSPGIEPPANGRPSGYTDQANQDWGHHEFVFGLMGHAGDWRTAQTDWQAYRLNDPMMTFQTEKHPGSLGKTFSLVHLSNARVRILALKRAENSDEIILRMVELDGKAQSGVQVSFAGPVVAAREVNAQEQPLGPIQLGNNGSLSLNFTPYQTRTIALRLGTSSTKLTDVASHPVSLSYDLSVASNDDTNTSGGGFDGAGRALPAEMLPSEIHFNGVNFRLATAKTGTPDAIAAKGQTIPLPQGRYNRIYILAAAIDGDQKATFQVGDVRKDLTIQDWTGFIGQWDTRQWKNQETKDWAISANHAVWPPADLQEREKRPASPRYPEDYLGLKPGYIKPAALAWYVSHLHTPAGLNEPYQYSYLFAYSIDVDGKARSLKLPDNDKIRILAISTVQEDPELTPAAPLFDTLNRTEPENIAHNSGH
jgi:alpha-mannosidase